MLAQQPVIDIGYWSICRKRVTPRAATSSSFTKSAKAGRLCRSCGVCQLLPAGTLGRGEIDLLDLGLELRVERRRLGGLEVDHPERRREEFLDFLLLDHAREYSGKDPSLRSG